MDDRHPLAAAFRVARNTVNTTSRLTHRMLLAIPKKLHTTRLHLQRVANKSLRNTPFSSLSDEYIHGAIDMLAFTALTAAALSLAISSIRRYPTAEHIPAHFIRRQRTLHGSVVAVRDGDNLRVRHTPPLYRLFRMYMRPRGRNISSATINVRLAGVDAPECGKFGAPGQKHGPAARDWLKKFVGRHVSVTLHRTDQYKRVVATVWAESNSPLARLFGIGRKNVGLELVKAGYATTYTSAGAVYGKRGMKEVYLAAEAAARSKRRGMWTGPVVTPGEYKRALKVAQAAKAVGTEKQAATDASRPAAPGMLRAMQDLYHFLKKFR